MAPLAMLRLVALSLVVGVAVASAPPRACAVTVAMPLHGGGAAAEQGQSSTRGRICVDEEPAALYLPQEAAPAAAFEQLPVFGASAEDKVFAAILVVFLGLMLAAFVHAAMGHTSERLEAYAVSLEHSVS
eukprot:CAMPEP_0177222618 /NCGR_PEP_ID=MMETSP0367-20130122/38038_1 /TAXON_ID=447022 ORGANISM="Scrippsiella hangoei-like, Strain SHHI-4" /NCGR_SAMPLE_ID=MMETSP0367 /ASSEMBLY_ACC=CAM_ASM_000362 /LENGTH=129 /DNA_ID=CAMNT_0018672515 /DNA_START=65 /DNA_END=454 /DNA_ORIENTATION=+